MKNIQTLILLIIQKVSSDEKQKYQSSLHVYPDSRCKKLIPHHRCYSYVYVSVHLCNCVCLCVYAPPPHPSTLLVAQCSNLYQTGCFLIQQDFSPGFHVVDQDNHHDSQGNDQQRHSGGGKGTGLIGNSFMANKVVTHQ